MDGYAQSCAWDYRDYRYRPVGARRAVPLRQNGSANRFPVPSPPLSDHTNPPSPDTSTFCAIRPVTDYGSPIIGNTSSATKTNYIASANTSAITRPVGRRTHCILTSPRSPVKPVNPRRPTAMRCGCCRDTACRVPTGLPIAVPSACAMTVIRRPGPVHC